MNYQQQSRPEEARDYERTLDVINSKLDTILNAVSILYGKQVPCRASPGVSYTLNKNRECIVISGGTNDIHVTFGNGKMEASVEPITEEAVVLAERKPNDFKSYIPNNLDKEMIIERLHNLIDNKYGVEVVKVFAGAIKCGMMTGMPSFGVAKSEFGEICKNSNYYVFIKKNFYAEELQPIIDILKA